MTMATQCSVEPFPRPDHKAKKHGRPKPKAWYRRAVRRQCELSGRAAALDVGAEGVLHK